MGFELRALSSDHQVENFTCGRIDEMDIWFRSQALSNHEKRLTRVFVLSNEESRAIGFFTLSGYCLEVSALRANDFKNHKSRKTVPAHYLGRLALDTAYQGKEKGLGEFLIMALFSKYAQILELTTSNFLCLDAHNEKLADYYQKFGFKRAKAELDEGQPIPMYLRSSAVLTALEKFNKG